MSELVTIDHGFRCVFVCGSRLSRQRLLPHMKRVDHFDYIVGDAKPNYPLPVLRLAVTYQDQSISLWSTTQRRWEDKPRRVSLLRRWYHPKRFK